MWCGGMWGDCNPERLVEFVGSFCRQRRSGCRRPLVVVLHPSIRTGSAANEPLGLQDTWAFRLQHSTYDTGLFGLRSDGTTQDSTTYHRVEGWERYRTGGGANQITLRKVTDEYMCGNCMKMRQHGVHVDQGKLFR